MSVVTALVLVLLAAAPLHAQSSATLQGRVFDASDAVIIGATVIRRISRPASIGRLRRTQQAAITSRRFPPGLIR